MMGNFRLDNKSLQFPFGQSEFRNVYSHNGSMTKYVYSASGQKLRVVHYTAKPNMNKTWGVKPKFSMTQIQLTDSTDYLLGGSLVMQNGKIDKLLYEGGYAQVRPASNKFAFYYYNQDHLGNNREVVDAKGRILQTTNYYAFGMTSDESSSSIQPYKYNGKELDRMHGLDTYDYGARQYNPITARWDRIDPLCEKYYSISPYAYCANNPVMLVDPDGKDVLFGTSDANQIQMILDWINSLARGTFAYEISDEHRGLYLKELKETDKGSQSYTDALIESINNHEQDIVVKITNRVLFRGKEENVDEVYGGGVTYQDKEQGSHSPIIIYMSGNEHKGLLSEGTFKPLKQTPNFIFAHEFYCHAHKYMYPNKVMGRNATTLENVIRRELQKYDKNILLRAIVDINHKKADHPAIGGN